MAYPYLAFLCMKYNLMIPINALEQQYSFRAYV